MEERNITNRIKEVQVFRFVFFFKGIHNSFQEEIEEKTTQTEYYLPKQKLA